MTMPNDIINKAIEVGNEDCSKSEVFSHISKLGEIVKQAGGLNDLFYEFAREHLEFLSRHLQLSITGAALLSALVNLYDGNDISVTKLAYYLRCTSMEIISCFDEFEILEQREFLHIIREEDDFRNSSRQISFEIRFNTINALRKGDSDPGTAKNLSIEKFLNRLEALCEGRVQRRHSFGNTMNVMRNLLHNNDHLLFVKKVKELSLLEIDIFVLLRFFHYLVNIDEPEMDFYTLGAIFDHSSDFSDTKRKLKDGSYILLQKGLIENSYSDGFSDAESFRLTDSVKEDYLVELEGQLWKTTEKSLKSFHSIPEKNLFYPEKTKHAINELISLLTQENFTTVQKRLTKNGMRQGFACLFLGSPGTGKTETAYQIARITGRDILHVDIASVKSKWFGESEKQIKNIFEKYRSSVRGCKVTPILLFNEADAILGKRRYLDEKYNGPGQTENAIQNIILSEIENLNGILIATTNLENNFDPAFERRFLYKIEFNKPDIKTRKWIWLSMIPKMSEKDASCIASRFDFSGGQIENIARKTTVHEVLSGDFPVLDNIIKFCSNESYGNKNTRPIGFNVNS